MQTWFANLRISSKLFVLNGLSAIALIVVGLIAWLQFGAIERIWAEHQATVSAKNDELRKVRAGMGFGGAIHAFKNYVIRGDTAQSDYRAEFRSAAEQTREAIRAYRKCGTNAREDAALRSLEEMVQAYTDALEVARRLHAESKAPAEIDDAVRIDDRPFLSAFDTIADELGAALDARRQRLSDELARAGVTVAAIIVAAIVVTGLFGVMIARRITRPLGQLSEISTAIASGSVKRDVPDALLTHDEPGTVARSFRAMVEYLSNMADAADRISKGDVGVEVVPRTDADVLSHSFARMVEYVNSMAAAMERLSNGDLTTKVSARSAHDSLSRNFNDAVRALLGMARRTDTAVTGITASTSETMAGVRELASSASSQAAAVSETIATVEELRQSSDQVAERARAVAGLARGAADAADAGQRTVDETVAGMQRVVDSIATIARAILSLSEQTQAVGKITATVNDLAEQSKMLAFNAAIEAAKAGEFGRGFGVVANEIRSLAEQSKQATGQIADILNDIQKASNQSVMVTEHGTRESERGMTLATASGEKIRLISEAIRSTAQNAMQIESSTLQQARGMDQIAQAMASINATANQTRAAGSQMDRAMQDLNALADQLKASVAGYRLDDTRGRHAD
ncbi:MAG: methyl-accepting chemotaxis protein [Planctomycetota bacterium]